MVTLAAVAGVAIVWWLLRAGSRWVDRAELPWPVGYRGRLRARGVEGRPEELLLLELELSRIAHRLQLEYDTVQPGKAERVRAWVIAYDRVLIEIGERSAIPPPHHLLPLSPRERFALEHTLVSSGRSW